VARPVKNPMLEHRVSAVVAFDRAGIADPAWSLTAADGRTKIRARLRLSDDLVTIDGIDGHVAIAMEHDGRYRLPGPTVMRRSALPHGSERRGHITGGPARQPGVDSHGRIEVRVGRTHDRRRCSAG
jgi:hypothetical protein